MELSDGRITILARDDGVTIEIEDSDANISFVKASLTPSQFAQSLSRLALTPCKVEVFQLYNVGKNMVHKKHEFKMPDSGYSTRVEIAKAESLRVCPRGWESDQYFGSQDSFFTRNGPDGKEGWARTTIRKWI